MATVNRSAIVVTPKQPFLDWVNSVDPADPQITLREAQSDPSIYLVPEPDTEDDIEKIVRDFYRQIFCDQLAGWYSDEETWPKDRSFQVFQGWFTFQHHSMLFDLCDEPLTREGE